MSRFSHADPRYAAALAEMGRNLQKLLDDRDWTQADLVRAAALHMPIDPGTGRPARMAADNISNLVNGKRRPIRATIKAVSAALGVAEEVWLPSFLRDIGATAAEVRPILTEVPGKDGVYRVFIDRELTLPQALRVIAALGEDNHAS